MRSAPDSPAKEQDATTGDSRDRTAPPALAMEGIRVRYRDRLALDLGSLVAAPGERVAIVGPNGAGKTTLLHAAALMLEPDAGAIRIGGETATRANRNRLRRQTALVLQHPALFSMPALRNAALGPRLRGAGRQAAEAIARGWLARFGVEHLADRKPSGLSGGEAQRVALARAFAADPRLLLLDEPFAALDPASRADLLPALADALAATGAAAVLVTHDLREAAAFSHRLGVLLDGRLIQSGPPEETMARPVTAAAARLLGVENLAPGRAIRGVDGWMFRPATGTAMIPCGSAGEGVADGTECWLAVRAGAIALREPAVEGMSACGLSCRIARVEVTPDGWRVALAGDVPLVVSVPWFATPPVAGHEALAVIPPACAHLVA
jgi:ABC-type sulfate/molybdate transport systems ATPase subunit